MDPWAPKDPQLGNIAHQMSKQEEELLWQRMVYQNVVNMYMGSSQWPDHGQYMPPQPPLALGAHYPAPLSPWGWPDMHMGGAMPGQPANATQHHAMATMQQEWLSTLEYSQLIPSLTQQVGIARQASQDPNPAPAAPMDEENRQPANLNLSAHHSGQIGQSGLESMPERLKANGLAEVGRAESADNRRFDPTIVPLNPGFPTQRAVAPPIPYLQAPNQPVNSDGRHPLAPLNPVPNEMQMPNIYNHIFQPTSSPRVPSASHIEARFQSPTLSAFGLPPAALGRAPVPQMRLSSASQSHGEAANLPGANTLAKVLCDPTLAPRQRPLPLNEDNFRSSSLQIMNPLAGEESLGPQSNPGTCFGFPNQISGNGQLEGLGVSSGRPQTELPASNFSNFQTPPIENKGSDLEKWVGQIVSSSPALRKLFVTLIDSDLKPPHDRDHLKPGQVIASGGFGSVRMAVDVKMNRTMAVKTIDVNGGDLLQIKVALREVEIMTQLQNEENKFVVRYQDVFATPGRVPGARCFHIVMQYYPFDLEAKLKAAPVTSMFGVQSLVVQVFQALEFIHHRQIVHRDIKMNNFLVDHHGSLRLADFGCSRHAMDENEKLPTKSEGIGPCYFRPPEMLLQVNYGYPADIWSAGIVASGILGVPTPFGESSRSREVLFRIFKTIGLPPSSEWPLGTPFPRDMFTHVEPNDLDVEVHENDQVRLAKKFLESIFLFQPHHRPTAHQCLVHPFLTQGFPPPPPKTPECPLPTPQFS